MKFNIKEAVLYLFRDKTFILKLIVLSVIGCVFMTALFMTLLPFEILFSTNIFHYIISIQERFFTWIMLKQVSQEGALLSILLTLPFIVYFFGYMAKCAHGRISNEEKLPPLKNVFSILKTGLAYVTGIFIIAIPITLILQGIIHIEYQYFYSLRESYPDLAWIYQILRGIIGLVILFLGTFVALPYFLLPTSTFISDLKFKSFFNFKRMKKILECNKKSYLKMNLWLILFFLICIALIYVICAGFSLFVLDNKELSDFIVCFVACILVSAVVSILNLIAADIQSQFIKKVFVEESEKSD